MGKCFHPFFLICIIVPFFVLGCAKDKTGNESEEQKKEIYENVEKASSTTQDIFSKCSSVSQLQSHIDEIKKLKGVNDAYISEDALFIDINGWGKIAYLYPEQFDISSNNGKNVSNSTRKINIQTKGATNDDGHYSVCIANQAFRNEMESFIYANNNAFAMFSVLELCGIHCEVVHPTLEWYLTEMFNYDSVILLTHGYVDRGLHWILTSDEVDKERFVEDYSEIIKKHEKDGNFDIMPVCVKERRDGVDYIVWYIAVSEKMIRSIPGGGFSSELPHIVFNIACHSLQGNNSLADAFIDQGANFYFGFNNKDSIGPKSMSSFFTNLLDGMSVEQAYTKMDNKRERLDDGAISELLCIDDGIADAGSSFILPPFLPKELYYSLGQYLPIHRGYYPPMLEGDYLVNPIVYLYDSSYNHYVGQRDSYPAYFRFSNQDNSNLTINFEESASGGIEYDYGSGSVYGFGDEFTIVSDGITEVTGFTLDSSLNMEYYTIYGDAIWIITGTKVGDTVENWQYGWFFKSIIKDRPEGGISKFPDVGTTMVFKDGDGVSGYYPFPSVNSQQ